VKKGQMVCVLCCLFAFLTFFIQLAMWHETGHRADVTCIVQAPQKHTFAVGYADGSVRLWNASTVSVLTTFNGHRKAVTALAFGERGTRLASGSQDTDLIIWDVIAEAGICRYLV
jgi:U3 small nucleolar RNA-associated protein 12